MKTYPKPKEIGGKLIRSLMSELKGLNLTLPITSHILIGISSGSDSMALALLLAKYGRRVAHASRLRLLHINHGWRGEESDLDESFLRAWAEELNLPFDCVRIKPGLQAGRSPEEEARAVRHSIFDEYRKKWNAPVFTAHHANDVVETYLWRLFTGSVGTHGGSILTQFGCQIRPLLQIRKEDLIAFLKEENQTWREDRTNFEGQLLRSKMRIELMPVIRRLFPKAENHILKEVRKAKLDTRAKKEAQSKENDSLPNLVFGLTSVLPRRAHWEALRLKATEAGWRGMLQLPGGWVLRREKPVDKKVTERWVIERVSGETLALDP